MTNESEILDGTNESIKPDDGAPRSEDVNSPQQILNPTEFSKKIFHELSSRHVRIAYKQVDEIALKKIIKECKDSADELFRKGHLDANILYQISTDKQEYNGADEVAFLDLFCSSDRVNSFQISVAGKYDKSRARCILSLTVVISNNPSSKSEITVLGDEEIWVKNAHARFVLLIQEFKGANKIFYSIITEFFVQLFAVIFIFSASVAAVKFSGTGVRLFDQVFIFAAVLLLGSNIWSFALRLIRELRGKYFPIITFKEHRAEKWLIRIFVSFMAFFLWWLMGATLDFIKERVVEPPSSSRIVNPGRSQ